MLLVESLLLCQTDLQAKTNSNIFITPQKHNCLHFRVDFNVLTWKNITHFGFNCFYHKREAVNHYLSRCVSSFKFRGKVTLQAAQVIFLCVIEYLTAWWLHGSEEFPFSKLNIHHLGATEKLHLDMMAKWDRSISMYHSVFSCWLSALLFSFSKSLYFSLWWTWTAL